MQTHPARIPATMLLGFACAAILAACAPGADQREEDATSGQDPIRIGFVGELTGPFAVWGIPARNGMRMAVEDLNAEGGIGGRPLELIERDTQGVPEEGATVLRGMIERDGVVAAGGLVSSDVALATARVAEQEQLPLFLVKAGAESILTLDSRFTFRTCLPAAPMNMQPLEQFIASEGITRIGAVVADYAWGRAIEDAIEERIAVLDGVEVRTLVTPVPETDFTSTLRQLEDLDPQMIIATGHPPGAATLARQAADLGFDAFVTGSNSSAAAVFEAVGEAAFGRYVDFTCADYESDGYRELAVRYHDVHGEFMEDDAVSGYAQVMMVSEAIDATGTTDTADIAAYLREHTFTPPGYAWELGWTGWGELERAQPMLVVHAEREAPHGVNPGAEWFPETVFQSEPLDPHVP